MATTKYLRDYAPNNCVGNTSIHVFGANASDTALLNYGRGLTADLPFASLAGALAWIRSRYAGNGQVEVILHADATVDLLEISAGAIGALVIASDSTRRTITINDGIAVVNGNAVFHDVNLKGSANAKNIFRVNGWVGQPSLTLYNSVISGKVSDCVVSCTAGGKFVLQEPETVSGSVEGKRYALSNGGRILTYGRGENAIPGTVAGTKDSGSVYA